MDTNQTECKTCIKKSEEIQNPVTRADIIEAALSFIMLVSGMVMHFRGTAFFQNPHIQLVWYGVPFAVIIFPVLKDAWHLIKNKDSSTKSY